MRFFTQFTAKERFIEISRYHRMVKTKKPGDSTIELRDGHQLCTVFARMLPPDRTLASYCSLPSRSVSWAVGIGTPGTVVHCGYQGRCCQNVCGRITTRLIAIIVCVDSVQHLSCLLINVPSYKVVNRQQLTWRLRHWPNHRTSNASGK